MGTHDCQKNPQFNDLWSALHTNAEVTGFINARPLVPVSTDPEEPTWRLLGHGPVHKAVETSSSSEFWNRWSRKYLPALQHRQKWTLPRRNLQIGDLVLLMVKHNARSGWPMARIITSLPGKDGHVRKVEMKRTDQRSVKTFLRPITETVLVLPKDWSRVEHFNRLQLCCYLRYIRYVLL